MTVNRNIALKRFHEARKQADRTKIASMLTGRNNQTIPFEAIRRELRQQNPLYRGVINVALDAIVGSVGRYQEFTRSFLPLNDSLAERWVGVSALALGTGWPPIELYQVGAAYFVKGWQSSCVGGATVADDDD